MITVVTDGGGGGPSRVDRKYSREEKTTFVYKKRPCGGDSIRVGVGRNVTEHHTIVEYTRGDGYIRTLRFTYFPVSVRARLQLSPNDARARNKTVYTRDRG